MKKLIILLVILISFGLLFGCTESSDNINENETQETEAETNNQNKTNQETQEDSQTETIDEVDMEDDINSESEIEVYDSEVFEEFIALLSKLPNYRVNYDVTAAGQNYELIQYVYNGEIRSDITTQGVETRTFILKSGIKTCTNMGSWMCFDVPSEANEQTSNNVEEIKENPDKYRNNVISVPSQTVLGQQTSCFEVSDNGSDYIYCLNSNGVPLLIEGTTNGSEYIQIATNYSASVSAEDLVPPTS